MKEAYVKILYGAIFSEYHHWAVMNYKAIQMANSKHHARHFVDKKPITSAEDIGAWCDDLIDMIQKEDHPAWVIVNDIASWYRSKDQD